jgi:hypothetical protein
MKSRLEQYLSRDLNEAFGRHDLNVEWTKDGWQLRSHRKIPPGLSPASLIERLQFAGFDFKKPQARTAFEGWYCAYIETCCALPIKVRTVQVNASRFEIRWHHSLMGKYQTMQTGLEVDVDLWDRLEKCIAHDMAKFID